MQVAVNGLEIPPCESPDGLMAHHMVVYSHKSYQMWAHAIQGMLASPRLIGRKFELSLRPASSLWRCNELPLLRLSQPLHRPPLCRPVASSCTPAVAVPLECCSCCAVARERVRGVLLHRVEVAGGISGGAWAQREDLLMSALPCNMRKPWHDTLAIQGEEHRRHSDAQKSI